MKDAFDHRPDPELGAALRAALDPSGEQRAFVAAVLARYDDARQRAAVPTWEVLASWSRRGVAIAVAALLLIGILFGRTALLPTRTADDGTAIEAAIAPSERPGLTALLTAPDPPDASVVLRSLVERQ
jgi:hypothetical protein